MKVSDEKINEWKLLKEKGDNSLLAKILKTRSESVSRILNTGETTLKSAKLIDSFFKKRKKERSAFES